MKKHIIFYIASMMILGSIFTNNTYGNEVNTQTQNQQLGKSTNPYPSNLGGLTSTTARHPIPSQAGTNAVQLPTNNTLFPVIEDTSGTIKTLPAWANTDFQFPSTSYLQPFGANLFLGNFASSFSDDMNSHYIIQAGDRIVVRIWGAKIYDDILIVDQHGNIFLPEIGPIQVAGLKQSVLSSAVSNKISEVFIDNINSYVSLQSSQSVGIYVTGFVNSPGRYAGGSRDSVLSYLDRAGGISLQRGSYRNILVKRGNRTLAKLDLYDFILKGTLPTLRLQDGDTIIVEEIKSKIIVTGAINQEAIYEFTEKTIGKEILKLSSINPTASHVSLRGMREGVPINKYYSLAEFANIPIQDGDNVNVISDTQSDTIMVSVSGAIQGKSHFPINNATSLKNLLPYIAVDADLADTSSIYILRHSIAEQQKVILKETLQRLEQSALTATSSTEPEAAIKAHEATLVQDYIKRASQIQPTGLLVVHSNSKLVDTLLEDRDIIVIPQKTNTVHITGEVMIPNAILWDKNMNLPDYIQNAGGYSNRADKKNVLVIKVNGEISKASEKNIEPGDRILVMPKFAGKNVELLKGIIQILYQIAVATKIAVDL